MAKTSKSTAKPTASKKQTRTKTTATKKGGPTAANRILEAIAGQLALGIEKADRQTIQGLAAMDKTRSFNTTILNMKNQGLVLYDTTTIWLTEAGVERVGPEAVAKPQGNEAMQSKLKEQVKGKQPKAIFDLLTNGDAFTRPELARMMGLEDTRSFGTYISALSKVVEREGGKIRLKQIAFPCGRPCNTNN